MVRIDYGIACLYDAGAASHIEDMDFMAAFNYEISLRDEAERLGQKRCFVDLYYKQAKVGVEYESFKFHSSPSEQGKDSVRSAILEKQGIEMMHLSTIQLYDPDAFRDFAINLSRHLNKRIYIRAKKFARCMSSEDTAESA